MRFWFQCTLVAVSVSALTSAVLAPVSSETAMSIDNSTYLAPLYESCPAGSSTCGTIDGTYLVMLRKRYNPSSHLSFITENFHIDPVKEWQLEWFNEQHYIASDVSMDLLNLLRQDPGIEAIEEGSWFEVVEVDRCQNSAFSEDERKQCYDAGPFDACKNEVLSEDEMWICGKMPESEESEPFEATLVDRYRVPEYSD
ncbi:hypothetical protein KCU77_g701, partial [Aureobasidium melanogenum]